MLKVLKIVLSIIVFVLAGYSLISGNHEVLPYMIFFMGAMFLVMGIADVKDARKNMGIASIIFSFFVFYFFIKIYH